MTRMGEVVTVTDAAAARTRALLHKTGGGGVRVTVQSAGCEGFVALMDLAPGPADGEIEVEDNGVRLFVDVASMLRLPGATLDHRSTPHGAEFVWSHPASERGCTCAEEGAHVHGDA
jgi:iron-sulfur cluster assembly accessory protein